MGIYRSSNGIVIGIRNVDCRLSNGARIAHVQKASAMRGRIALQSTSCETRAGSVFYFAQARHGTSPSDWRTLRVHARPHVAFVGWTRRVPVFALILLAIAPLSIFGAARNYSVVQLGGYKAVRVHYGPMNQMIMSVRINGQPANLLVDTGSNQLILDAETASSFGIKPSPRGLRYIRYTHINGQDLPVGFVQNMSAGGMNFGGGLVTLRDSNYSRGGVGVRHVDGMLGLDILLRYKALINCRTKLVFFKLDQGRRINLGSVAATEKFTRVPIQREENGALTVPCSIRGHSARLLIDTGAFVTILHERFAASLGLAAKPTRISAQFSRGGSKKISATKLDDFSVGAFRMRPEKFGVAPLPRFALQQGNSKIAGILGMDALYICHAIIDLDGMNLFLK